MGKWVTCGTCHGTGQMRCSHCGGKGEVKHGDRWYNCAQCSGRGHKTCIYCGGKGEKYI